MFPIEVNLFKAFRKPPTTVRVVVINRESTALRIHEWRASEELCASAAKLMRDPDLQVMLQVVENEHPANVVLREDVPIEMRAIYQARAEGYTLALANLRALSKFVTPVTAIEEEFSPIE